MMWNGPMMGWMWIWSLLGLAVLAILVWLVVRLTVTGRPDPTGTSSARRILDDRYARGEIDEEEYRRRRAGLS